MRFGSRAAYATAAVAALLAPFVLGSHVSWTGPARLACLLLAALGLNVAVGHAGQPSLAQGAFAGVGAYTTAILRARHNLDPFTAVLAGTAAAAIAGIVFARGVARLRPPFVAIAGWASAWAFLAAVNAFPGVSGGAGGIVLAPARINVPAFGIHRVLGPRALYIAAIVAVMGFAALAQRALTRYGPVLAAARTDPQAAGGAGVDVARVRFGALVASAIAGGLAGGLLVTVDAVADPTVYGPLLSATLFIVVLLGGAGTFVGPFLGLIALIAVQREAALIAHAGGVAAAVPFAAAITLGIVVFIGERGIVAAFLHGRRHANLLGEDTVEPRAELISAVGIRSTPGSVNMDNLSVRFGAVNALDGVSIAFQAGQCSAVIGPNGSGKTTLLRVLNGAIAATAGTITLDGEQLSPEPVPERAARGIVRTFQRTAIAPELTAFQHALSGTEPFRRAGFASCITRTPAAVVEDRAARASAHHALAVVGLDDRAHVPAGALDAAEQRLLMVARAIASVPKVLLLDEPSAGMRPAEEQRLRDAIEAIMNDGVTVVVVEHNLRLVRDLATSVTVLDAGSVVATGRFEDIAENDDVRAAYLGVPVSSRL